MAHLSLWGRVYVLVVAALGAATIIHSIVQLYLFPVGWNWIILALLTLLSGSATVRLPSVPATISISETFVFTSALLFGPAAGTLTVALDALVISLWLARLGHPPYRIAFNVFALPGALWAGAQLYYIIGNVAPLHVYGPEQTVEISRLLVPLTVFTLTYFLLNSGLIAFAISLEKQVSPIKVWRDNFAWLSLNYAGGASIAALLVTYTRNIDYAYLAFVLPLLGILYFTFSVSMGRVEDANRHLSQLNKLYMSTIETLAMAIDAKDQITHGHIRRVQQYAVGLARAMGVTDLAQISAIEAASLLHDMGKLAVPEYILNKPGRLTSAEFEKMKLHASVGADILSAIDFPYPVVPIVRHHHENWDGTGYPDRIRGSDIPIGARILSVVDCFDALTSDRPYRPRLSDGDAIRILVERRGTMYDPLVVDTFIRVHADLAPSPPEEVSVTSLSAITRGGSSPPEDKTQTGFGLNDIAASTEEMLVLYDLAQALAANLDVHDAAELISKHLRRVIPASTVVFYLYEQETDELWAAHSSGENAPHFAGLRIPRGQRLTGWVAANRQSILNSDPVLDLGDIARSLRPPLRSCLSTPIVQSESLVGVLTVYSTHRDGFTEDHRRVLDIIAHQISRTIQRALGLHKDREGLGRDQDTGLPSVSQLERIVATEVANLGLATELSLVWMRVRPPQRVTSAIGSSEASLAVTDAIRSSLRDADFLFHYRKSELVMVLLRTDQRAAFAVASRVASRIASIQVSDGERTVSVSLGVATAPKDGTDLTSLLTTAQSRALSTDEFPIRPPSVH
jgi:putative nucleotidyltransferase with HDIG domain